MPNPSCTSSPGPLPEEIRNLLADVETFVADTLKGENLSKKAKEKRESLIKKIKDVKSVYLQEFQDKGDAEDGDEYDDPFAGPADTISLASERYDKDDDGPSDGNQFPPIAAQDLPFVIKAGYLEKRRKDHSFLGFEWQKRWCALSKTVFYYYGSDKDKQQKGEFAIDGYDVRMNNTLRKDGKKDCCFEICAPDKRIYQFTAASPKDAEEWVQQLKFILQDLGSDVIPEDDEERGELYDDVDHPAAVSSPQRSQPIDDEIYEELPEEASQGAWEETTELGSSGELLKAATWNLDSAGGTVPSWSPWWLTQTLLWPGFLPAQGARVICIIIHHTSFRLPAHFQTCSLKTAGGKWQGVFLLL